MIAILPMHCVRCLPASAVMLPRSIIDLLSLTALQPKICLQLKLTTAQEILEVLILLCP